MKKNLFGGFATIRNKRGRLIGQGNAEVFDYLLVDCSILGQQLVGGNKLCVGPLQRLDLLFEGCHLGHQLGNGILGLLAVALG